MVMSHNQNDNVHRVHVRCLLMMERCGVGQRDRNAGYQVYEDGEYVEFSVYNEWIDSPILVLSFENMISMGQCVAHP